ncbi:hypothetical protein J2T60_001271 [Natronospira proteinivora]|uniref:ParB-like nuclease family protein n=1 Tax=Natronospira proteinivora TaxID=1807133 RepID=A0ABT1G7V4_9GAMM|nr:hypothetical protein [Natronospira proteinivora]MCP1727306.1 hypothetical protein [Natronospira proteinivora]
MNGINRWQKLRLILELVITPWLPGPRPQLETENLPANWSGGHTLSPWHAGIRQQVVKALRDQAITGHFPVESLPIDRLLIRQELEDQWPIFRLMARDWPGLRRGHPQLPWYRKWIKKRTRLNAKRKLAKSRQIMISLQKDGFQAITSDPVMVYRSPNGWVRNGGSHRLAILAATGQTHAPVIVLDRDACLADPKVPDAVKDHILELDPLEQR